MKTFGKLQAPLIFLALVNILPTLEADGAWWIMLLALVSAMGGLALAKPGGGSWVPGWVVLLGVIASVVYSAIEMFQPQTVYILDLAHFIIFLACCKFFELRTHRDMGLVLIICFLLLIIGAFVSASPLFGLVLLIDLLLGIAWLMRFQADRESSEILGRRKTGLAFVGDADFSTKTEAAAAETSSIRPALVQALALILIASIVFVCIPRGWGRGLFGRFQRAIPVGVTSFTDEIQLRDATILEDASLFMRVKFTAAGRPIGGDDFQPYLRGATFERYLNGRWRKTRPRVLSEINANRDGLMRLLPHAPSPILGDRVVDQEVWLETVPQGVLFSTYPPLLFGSTDVRRVQQSQADLTIETDDQLRGGVSYHATSLAPGATQFTKFPDAPPPRRLWSQGFSTIHGAIRQFTGEYVSPFDNSEDPARHEKIARRICDYLHSGGFQYSLKRGGSSYEGDRVKDFLFHNGQGHCEYFASAMTLMCQSMEIPARMVSGFHGGEYNTVGNFYQFRAKDAHAWVEVWLPDRGWVVFDPTPAAVMEYTEAQDSLWTQSRRIADFMRFKWATTVVSFDAASRQELFDGLEGWLKLLVELKHRPESIPEGIAAWLWGPDVLSFWQRLVYWLFLALMTIFLVLLVRILWILSLMAREYWQGKRGTGRFARRPDARFYDRLVLLLENKGHVRPRHQTPREFAAELAAASEDFTELPRCTEWFYAAQYGGQGPTTEQWQRIKSLLTRLREDPAFGAR